MRLHRVRRHRELRAILPPLLFVLLREPEGLLKSIISVTRGGGPETDEATMEGLAFTNRSSREPDLLGAENDRAWIRIWQMPQ